MILKNRWLDALLKAAIIFGGLLLIMLVKEYLSPPEDPFKEHKELQRQVDSMKVKANEFKKDIDRIKDSLKNN